MAETVYVLGFIFSPDLKDVYLIRKTHPEWQKDLLNGVGGRIKDKEFMIRAMMREAEEESGYKGEFTFFLHMRGPGWDCPVYYSIMGIDQEVPSTREEEEIEKVAITSLLEMAPQMISNLPWLILAALNHISHGGKKFRAEVEYY